MVGRGTTADGARLGEEDDPHWQELDGSLTTEKVTLSFDAVCVKSG